MNEISIWRKENIEKALKDYATAHELGMGKIIMPIRLAVSGGLTGPNVFEILDHLGKEDTINRIETALNVLPL